MRVAAYVSRFAVGALFVYAGAIKLKDPAAFAVEIDHYELWPATAPYLAVVLPGVELALGATLLSGPRLWRRAAALGCGALMGAFTLAAATAVARGLNIDCGCFGGDASPITWLTLARDVALLAACGIAVWDPSAAARR